MRKNHYRGFIDTCVTHGMDKSAADLLYKQAQFQLLGRGLGYGARAATVAGNVAARGLRAGGKLMYYVPDYTLRAGNWMVGKAGQGLRYAGGEIAKGYRAVNPAAAGAGMTMPKHMFAPMGAMKMFTRRHPKTALLAALAGGAYLTHIAENGNNDDNTALLPTMTPSEQAVYDRYMSGMNLPGLGLDPALFKGSYSSYL